VILFFEVFLGKFDRNEMKCSKEIVCSVLKMKNILKCETAKLKVG